MTDIAIIGAGAAGIAAARRLAELGRDYILLEAKPFIGGRCITDTTTLNAPVDLGAHWLHSPAINPLRAFADQLGVRYSKTALDGRYMQSGLPLDAAAQAECEEYVDRCFDLVTAAGKAGQDQPIAELLAGAIDPRWHPVFLAELMAKQGVALADCSAVDFARYTWEGDDLPVLDGFGSLLARLGAGLNLRTATPVSRIDWSDGKRIRLTTPAGTLDAARIILAVPVPILGHGIAFMPGLPDWKQQAIGDLPLGSCNKVVLGFSGPVFNDCGPSLIMPLRGATESTELVVREDGHDIATCLVNGPFAKELAAAGTDAMTAYALDCLVEIFGNALRRRVLPKSVIADWDHDPYIRGCYAAARPGRPDARADLARNIDTRLFFAGEACAGPYIGDVHNAWFSGIDAADAASRSLGH